MHDVETLWEGELQERWQEAAAAMLLTYASTHMRCTRFVSMSAVSPQLGEQFLSSVRRAARAMLRELQILQAANSGHAQVGTAPAAASLATGSLACLALAENLEQLTAELAAAPLPEQLHELWQAV